jgi:SAM-dependent methyltransferase
MENPIEQNRRVWNERARLQQVHATPAGEKEFRNARAIVDQCGWLPKELGGVPVLCLAAGGGWHGPLFAHLGAEVTVVDISEEMLALDRKISKERKLRMKIVRASMDDLSDLPRATYEIVIQPVSTCYVSDLARVYREIANVTKPEGIYISQHKQPVSLQASAQPGTAGYSIRHLYKTGSVLPAEAGRMEHRESGASEFIHTWESLVGDLCRSGFVIEDLVEPRHRDPRAEPGTFAHRSAFVPPYVTIKARRVKMTELTTEKLWVPSSKE